MNLHGDKHLELSIIIIVFVIIDLLTAMLTLHSHVQKCVHLLTAMLTLYTYNKYYYCFHL